MMKSLFILILLVLSNNCWAFEDVLIEQGQVKLSLKDVDGFAYTIPETERYGFFNNIERIDHTVKNLLNLNHMSRYIENNLKFDFDTIKKDATFKAEETYKQNFKDGYTFVNEEKYKLLRDFYYKKLLVGQYHEYLRSKILDSDLIDIAKEDYYTHEKGFTIPKSYELNMLELSYNDSNKNEVYNKANKLLEQLKSGDVVFDNLLNAKTKNDIIPSKVRHFNKFVVNPTNDISKVLEKSKQKIGLIDKVFDINNRYIILEINDIKAAKKIPFEDVKTELLKKYRNKKFDNEYNSIVLSITQDPAKINQELIYSLKERYKIDIK